MRGPALDSMAARVFVLLLAGVVAATVLAFAVSGLQARAAAASDREQRLVDRIADAAAVLAAAPAGARPGVLGAGPEALRLDPAATPGLETPGLETEDLVISARVNRRLGALALAQVSPPLAGPCLGATFPGPPPPPAPHGEPGPLAAGEPPPAPPPPPTADCRQVRLAFPGGERLALVAPLGPRPLSPPLPLGPAPLVAMILVAGGVAWAVARLAVAPLTRLADAARALGRDLDRAPLATTAGPREVRQAAMAFNTMQARLRQEVEERTHVLAAITHDLQTPLTRQRLRLERVADADLRDQLIADQEAMRVLIREGLDLARAAHEVDSMVELEIDSLLDSLAADAVAAGQDVRVVGECGRVVRTSPQAMARCLANLVDNALKYAGAAEMAATPTASGGVTVTVTDRGPGLPESELESLFEPFRRGETSRSRDTGGAGLGLTIARRLAERSGARLTLHNRPGGGLEARLALGGDLGADRSRPARLG